MRIAVCDDNPKELERIKGCFCRIQGYDLVCSYFDSTSTVMEILKTENSPYDLYILDIEMPGMNGLKLAKSIREKDSRALFVFLTSYTRYMKDVFDVVTFDFIEKPISDEKLLQILERAATYLNITSQHFSFGYRASRYSLKYDRILYIEKKGRQALIHTFEDVYKTNMTLEEIWKQLNPKSFVHIHSSYIINLYNLDRKDNEIAIMRNGEKLHITKGYRRELAMRHYEFVQGGMLSLIHI
mgnify:CR=1 FL=1